MCGYERGAESGTRHIQSYAELVRLYRISHIYFFTFSALGGLAGEVHFQTLIIEAKEGTLIGLGDFSREAVGVGEH